MDQSWTIIAIMSVLVAGWPQFILFISCIAAVAYYMKTSMNVKWIVAAPMASLACTVCIVVMFFSVFGVLGGMGEKNGRRRVRQSMAGR